MAQLNPEFREVISSLVNQFVLGAHCFWLPGLESKLCCHTHTVFKWAFGFLTSGPLACTNNTLVTKSFSPTPFNHHFLKHFLKNFFIFNYVYVCVFMCGHMHMSGAVHRGSYRQLSGARHRCWKTNLDPLKAVCAITTEPSPQPFIIHYWCFKDLKVSTFVIHCWYLLKQHQ